MNRDVVFDEKVTSMDHKSDKRCRVGNGNGTINVESQSQSLSGLGESSNSGSNAWTWRVGFSGSSHGFLDSDTQVSCKGKKKVVPPPFLCLMWSLSY